MGMMNISSDLQEKGIEYDSLGHSLSWTPSVEQKGVHEFTLTLWNFDDSKGDYESNSYTFTVEVQGEEVQAAPACSVLGRLGKKDRPRAAFIGDSSLGVYERLLISWRRKYV